MCPYAFRSIMAGVIFYGERISTLQSVNTFGYLFTCPKYSPEPDDGQPRTNGGCFRLGNRPMNECEGYYVLCLRNNGRFWLRLSIMRE